MIEIHNKFPDDITFKNVAILNTCLINNNDKSYSQLFLEEALFDE